MDIVDKLWKIYFGSISITEEDAHDAIEEISTLRDRVAELEKQNGWINISYDSPEFELFSGEPLKVLGVDIPPLYKSERILYVCDGIVFTGKLDKLNETVMPKGTTHWMPLPKPPKD